MGPDIFHYDDYKIYLNNRLDDLSRGGGRGARSRLSQALGCQTAYTAQVLKGHAHFSLEQADAANDYLGHSEEEANYFLLLLQKARAGTPKLRERFERELTKIKEARMLLKNRFGVQSILNIEAQTQYYSSWYYAAVHVLASIPGMNTAKAMANHLSVELSKIQSALNFLCEVGILKEAADGYSIGTARLHLGADSPLIAKHHTNWRLQAIRSLERSEPGALHYSSVVSISEKDHLLIREMIVKNLEKIKATVRESKEEQAHCLSIDFFRV